MSKVQSLKSEYISLFTVLQVPGQAEFISMDIICHLNLKHWPRLLIPSIYKSHQQEWKSKRSRNNLCAEPGFREGRIDWFLSHVTTDLKNKAKKNYKIQHMHLKLEKTGNKISLLPTTLSYFLAQHSNSLALSSQVVHIGKTRRLKRARYSNGKLTGNLLHFHFMWFLSNFVHKHKLEIDANNFHYLPEVFIGCNRTSEIRWYCWRKS